MASARSRLGAVGGVKAVHRATTSSEQRVAVGCSWDTYERLLAGASTLGTRFAYSEGLLEIMVVSAGREQPNRTLATIVEIVAAEIGRDCLPVGSTTFKRGDLQKGFEPDSCFYFANAERVRGKRELDLAFDPPPDLVIEVDITRSSLNRFSIFAAVGVPEVWRFDGERVLMYRLSGDRYDEMVGSMVLPPLTAERATSFVHESETQKRPEWFRAVQEWVRSTR